MKVNLRLVNPRNKKEETSMNLMKPSKMREILAITGKIVKAVKAEKVEVAVAVS